MQRIIILVLIFTLSACATKYQEMGLFVGSGGYQDEQLSDGTIRVKFRSANAITSMDQINIYWSRRAGELCPSGYTVLSKEEKMIKMHNQYASASHPFIEGIIRCK